MRARLLFLADRVRDIRALRRCDKDLLRSYFDRRCQEGQALGGLGELRRYGC
jgi:hypothetical protein